MVSLLVPGVGLIGLTEKLCAVPGGVPVTASTAAALKPPTVPAKMS